MVTIEQTNFANKLDAMFGAIFPEVGPYFLLMADAIVFADETIIFNDEAGSEALLAKFCALAIIDLAQGGRDVEVEAQLWLRLFGNLPEFNVSA